MAGRLRFAAKNPMKAVVTTRFRVFGLFLGLDVFLPGR